MPLTDSLVLHLRLGVRRLRHDAAFTGFASLLLSCALGAGSSVWCLARATLWTPSSFPRPEALVLVFEHDPRLGRTASAVANVRRWMDHARSFEGLAAVSTSCAPLVLDGGGSAAELQCRPVTSQFFSVLAVAPAAGRFFTPEDVGSRRLVLSYRLWRDSFGLSPDIVGRPISLSGAAYEVIGVLPPRFEFIDNSTDVWYALGTRPGVPSRTLLVVGRLRPGVNAEAAEAELTSLMRADPALNGTRHAVVEKFRDAITASVTPSMSVLLVAGALLMLATLLNLMLLLSVRHFASAPSYALQRVLGAPPLMLMGSALFEVAVLVAGGLAGALIVAAWVLPALLRAFASLGGAPGLSEVSFGSVARFAVAGSAAAFLVLATFRLLLSRAHTSRASLWRASAAQVVAPRTRRLFFVIVVSEIAFATALVYGSWLLHQTVTGLARVRTGFEAHRVVSLRLVLSRAAAESPSRRVAVYTDLLRRLEEVPDILVPAGIRGLPLSQPYGTRSAAFLSMPTSEWDLVPVWIPPATRYAPSTHAELRLVTPRYFEALKIRMHEGRDFHDVDDFKAPAVAIVSASLARQVSSLDAPRQTQVSYEFAGTTRTVTVVGVVDDVLNKSLQAPAMPTVYIPCFQMPFANMTVVARVRDSANVDWAHSTIRAIDDAARVVDPAGTTSDARTLDSIVAAAGIRSRTAARTMLAISSLTCLIVFLGVYGTQTYLLRQRLGELAVRHVLGATRKALVQSLLRDALCTGLVGLSIGWVFAVVGAHLLRASLHGAPVVDLGGVLMVSSTITAGVLLASAPTARRAARLQPVEILRRL